MAKDLGLPKPLLRTVDPAKVRQADDVIYTSIYETGTAKLEKQHEKSQAKIEEQAKKEEIVVNMPPDELVPEALSIEMDKALIQNGLIVQQLDKPEDMADVTDPPQQHASPTTGFIESIQCRRTRNPC